MLSEVTCVQHDGSQITAEPRVKRPGSLIDDEGHLFAAAAVLAAAAAANHLAKAADNLL